jgi:glyoxylase-like metal-dependent hydrolase (beta-lactamase superfamily II)
MGAEPVYVPQAVLVKDNVYAIVGPLGQRSSANAGLNANYGFVVTAQGVILIDSGASAHSAAMLEKAVRAVTPKPIRWVLNTGSQDHRWLGNAYFAQKGAEVQAMANTVTTQQAVAAQQMTGLQRFVGDQLQGTVPSQAAPCTPLRKRPW